MQQCSNCGSSFTDSVKFCPDCGFPSAISSTQTPSESTPVTGSVELPPRVPSPNRKRDAHDKPLMVLPDGTVLKKKYRLRYHTAGGMGAVYRATRIDTLDVKKEYIIKEAASADPSEQVKLMIALTQERETLIRLNHLGLVKSEDFFIEGGACFLVLEYIDGEVLSDVLKATRPNFLPESKVIDWAIQICEALEYMHNQAPPLIYRDLKPSNIMVNKEGRIKIIDFGTTRVFKSGKLEDTSILGTLGFAAPEQCGTSQTDARSDIYSLGATMHYLLTNRSPAETPFVFPLVRELNPKISEKLERVIQKALEFEPANRYETATQMKEALSSDITFCSRCGNIPQERFDFCEICGGPLVSTKKSAYPAITSPPREPALIAKPAELDFGLVEEGDSSFMLVKINVKEGLDVMKPSVVSNVPWVKVKTINIEDNMICYQVKLITKGLILGKQDGLLSVVHKQGAVTIPVYVIIEPKIPKFKSRLELLWRFQTHGPILSSPAVSDNLVFFGSNDKNFYALSKKKGDLIWKHMAGDWIQSSPFVRDDLVAVGSHDRNIYLFEAETGKNRWHYLTSAPLRARPFMDDKYLYLGGEDKTIYVIEIKTGKVKYQGQGGDSFTSSIGFSNGVIFIGSQDGYLYAITDKVRTKWRFKADSAITSIPLIYNNMVYFGSRDRNFYAVDVETGVLAWKFKTGLWIQSSPCAYEGIIYFGSQDKSIYALDASRGNLIWDFQTNGEVDSSPCADNETIYVGSADGYIYALQYKKGRLIWKYKTDREITTAPFIDRNVLYVTSYDGHLYALQVR